MYPPPTPPFDLLPLPSSMLKNLPRAPPPPFFQALPIKALAMGATAVAANVPCGMWREHTRKFSPEWFLAVHATIPFVAVGGWGHCSCLLSVGGEVGGCGVSCCGRVEKWGSGRASFHTLLGAGDGAICCVGGRGCRDKGRWVVHTRFRF